MLISKEKSKVGLNERSLGLMINFLFNSLNLDFSETLLELSSNSLKLETDNLGDIKADMMRVDQITSVV